jgi:uncharacterized delta-60 repeat protein
MNRVDNLLNERRIARIKSGCMKVKINLGISLVIVTSVLRTLSAPGGLDPSFSGDGKLTASITVNNFGSDRARKVMAQPDGKIVVVGESDGRIALLRYQTNGVLDSAFGTGGVVVTPLGPNDFVYIGGAALLSDGRIVVGGEVSLETNPTPDLIVTRYLADGQLDSTFGSGGVLIRDLGYSEGVRDMTVQSDGHILLAAHGVDWNLNEYHFMVVRLLTNGNPDLTFDTDGIAETAFPNLTAPTVDAIVLQPDGKVVVTGYATDASVTRLVLARFGSSGLLDTTFGTNGLMNVSATNTSFYGESIALQADGKILVAGNASQDFSNYQLVSRFLTNGLFDPTFNGGTPALLPETGGAEVAVASNGDIYVCGNRANDFALMRYTPSGSLDSTFGVGGVVQTTFSSFNDGAASLAIQADGKVLVAGSAFTMSPTFTMALSRYLTDGVAAPVAPALTITTLPAAVQLSWPTNATGYLLETNSALNAPAGWGVLASNYNVLGTSFAVTNTMEGGSRFYRLRKP